MSVSATLMPLLALPSWSNKNLERRTSFFLGFIDLCFRHVSATSDAAEKTTIRCPQYVGKCTNTEYFHHHNHLTYMENYSNDVG